MTKNQMEVAFENWWAQYGRFDRDIDGVDRDEARIIFIAGIEAALAAV